MKLLDGHVERTRPNFPDAVYLPRVLGMSFEDFVASVNANPRQPIFAGEWEDVAAEDDEDVQDPIAGEPAGAPIVESGEPDDTGEWLYADAPTDDWEGADADGW